MASTAKSVSPSPHRRASDRVIGASVSAPADRTHGNSVRTDSHPSAAAAAALDEIRAGSHTVRIDAKEAFLANINEARTRLRWSVDAMAKLAGVPISTMSDALSGKDNRNFAAHWMLSFGPEFDATYNQVVDEKRGNTPKAKRARAAHSLGEFVRRFVVELEELA